MILFARRAAESSAKTLLHESSMGSRATIAQSVEQPPCKRQVGSSILPGGFRVPPSLNTVSSFRLQEESRFVMATRDLLECNVELCGERLGLRVQRPKVVHLDAVAALHLSDHQLRVSVDHVRR